MPDIAFYKQLFKIFILANVFTLANSINTHSSAVCKISLSLDFLQFSSNRSSSLQVQLACVPVILWRRIIHRWYMIIELLSNWLQKIRSMYDNLFNFLPFLKIARNHYYYSQRSFLTLQIPFSFYQVGLVTFCQSAEVGKVDNLNTWRSRKSRPFRGWKNRIRESDGLQSW
jgi:hypothetical protein